MLASTRLPIPVVRVSDSFWAKVAWMENLAAPDDSFAKAALTAVSEDWMVATKVEAFAWVEIVDVADTLTMPPDSDRFCAAVVMRREPSAEARAEICLVEPSTRLKPLNTALLTIVVI